MNRNIIKVGFGTLSLIGGFLPMASAGNYFASISHIGGLSWLLYPLALTALGLSITVIYKQDIAHLQVWIGVITLAGLILTIMTVSAGISTLNYMANSMSSFSFLRDNSAAGKISATVDYGGVMAVVGYLGMLLLNMIRITTSAADQGGQQ